MLSFLCAASPIASPISLFGRKTVHRMAIKAIVCTVPHGLDLHLGRSC